MKVLRVVGGLDPSFGGPSESAVNQCIATQEAGAQNTLVYPFHPAVSERNHVALERLNGAGVATRPFLLTTIARDRSYRWAISPELSRWTLRAVRRYDIIHVHTAWGAAQLVATYVSRWSRRPCVMTPHESLTTFDIAGSGSVPPGTKRRIKRQYMSRLSLIVFASSLERRDSLPFDSFVPSVVIPHPVQNILDRSQRAPRPQNGLTTIGFLGRLHPKKNIDLLLKAVAPIPAVKLVIAGDGDPAYRRVLIQVVADCGLTDRVEWLGFLNPDGRDAFLDSVDILAMPSAYECFGMAAAEAMARGVPTLVSKNCGIAELIRRHGCGDVVDIDLPSWTRAIMNAARSSNYAAMGDASLAAARKELSMEAFGTSMFSAYERLMLLRFGGKF